MFYNAVRVIAASNTLPTELKAGSYTMIFNRLRSVLRATWLEVTLKIEKAT